ncbi:MAG: hypothetical protein QNJ64_05275 [Crocosphaera sp.]|nr:hypothetical protein [Crocosphaera sp.]
MVVTNQTTMPINPIFNPEGDDAIENRSIWFGNTTNRATRLGASRA